MNTAKPFTPNATLSESRPTKRPIDRYDGGLSPRLYALLPSARSGDIALGNFQSFFAVLDVIGTRQRELITYQTLG
jgi:hypothetical protein